MALQWLALNRARLREIAPAALASEASDQRGNL
jgi:hypothetical protein